MITRIALVGCCKPKLERRAPAAELYLSPLFKLSLKHALANYEQVYIVSANYELVELDREIAPYDLEMKDVAKELRPIWGRRVWDRLWSRHAPPLEYHCQRCAWVGRAEELHRRPGARVCPTCWSRKEISIPNEVGEIVTVAIYAGTEYATPIRSAAYASTRHAHIVEPLAGKQMGQRLQWLRDNVLPDRATEEA